IGRQPVNGIENLWRLAVRHTGRRLVEEEHFWIESEPDGDLYEALLAVSECRHRQIGKMGDAENLEKIVAFLTHSDDILCDREKPPCQALALHNGERNVRRNRQTVEQTRGLECPHQAAARPLRGIEPRNILPVKDDPPARWPQVARN